MSWNRLPAEVQTTATKALTEKQLDAFKLELAGLSMRNIARHLEIARTTAQDRLEATHKALRAAGVRQDATGQWTIKEAA